MPALKRCACSFNNQAGTVVWKLARRLAIMSLQQPNSQYFPTKVVLYSKGRIVSLKLTDDDDDSIFSSVVLYVISFLIVIHADIFDLSLLLKVWFFHIIVFIIIIRQESMNKFIAYKFDNDRKLNGKRSNDKFSLPSSYESLVNSVVVKGNYTLEANTINEIVNNTQDDNKARIGNKSLVVSSYFDPNAIEYVSTSKVDINIGEVRILSRKIDEYEHVKDDSDDFLGRVASYRIRLTHNGCRWYIWRTYKEVEEAYKKVVITYPLVAVPRLVPIVLSKKTSMSQNPLENASKLIIEVGSKFSVDANRLSAEQILMTTWLHQIQRNAMLANNIVVRSFLNMPHFKEKYEYNAISKTNNSETTQNTTEGEDEDSTSQSEKVKRGWSGNTLNTFKFLHVSPAARGLYLDCSQKHNFKVRGGSFLSDKTKIDAGTPLCKLIMMELFEVEQRHGDRIDHIASKGKAKERVDILTNLQDNPIVLVLNLQIPGDPPVCIVAYFALPSHYKEKFVDDGDEVMVNYCKLVEKFFDIPMTEKDRLAEWGISDGNDDYNNDDDRKKYELAPGDGKVDLSELNSTLSSSQSHDESDSAKLLKRKKQPPANNTTAWPSDITWPSPSEPGALPLTHFINKRFKLIPQVVGGPWAVQVAVRSTPVLLGQKVALRYFRSEKYLEIDVHVGSSVIAQSIVGVCRGYASSFSTNMAIVIQGESVEELPERLLACICLQKIDINIRTKLGD